MVDFWKLWVSQVGVCSQCHSLHHSQRVRGLAGIWTPEELLLAALGGCFTTTLRTVAGTDKFDITDLEVEVNGTLRKSTCGYDFSAIVIRPKLRIACSNERERAFNLLRKAERLCLVFRAIDAPLRFEPKIEVIDAVFSV